MTPALRERPLVRRDVLLPLVRVALTHLRARCETAPRTRTTEGYVVAYRSDRQHTAPVPRALAGDAGQSTKTGALKRAAWRR